MNAFGKPVLLPATGASFLLERIPLTASADRGISERWLQEAIFTAPHCLPMQEIDASLTSLFPVCMELETGAGPADILFLTPAGQPVIIETKLWRNPEARREVVAQILDYAKELTGWTFETLDQRAAAAAKLRPGILIECLRRFAPGADEAAFVDGVNRCLRTGDLMLLIVGDGIRSGAEALVGFLERFGHLKFGLGLVEVALFRLHNGDVLMQPRVLARTEILQRTVLIGPQGPVDVQLAASAEEGDAAGHELQQQRDWFVAFWTDFLAQFRRKAPDLPAPDPARSTNLVFPMPPYGGRAWVSAYIAPRGGYAGVFLTFAKSFAQSESIVERLGEARESIERELQCELVISGGDGKYYVGVPRMRAERFEGPDRAAVVTFLVDSTISLLRAMQPRLQAYSADV